MLGVWRLPYIIYEVEVGVYARSHLQLVNYHLVAGTQCGAHRLCGNSEVVIQ